MVKTVANLGITIPKTTMEKLEIYRGDVPKVDMSLDHWKRVLTKVKVKR